MSKMEKTIRATFSDGHVMLFGDSYRTWSDQLGEYCRRFKYDQPTIEVATRSWIGYGGLKWCPPDKFQQELDKERKGRKATQFFFRPPSKRELSELSREIPKKVSEPIAEPEAPKALQACYHIIRRHKSDANFSYHMTATETLSLVCGAIAEHRGIDAAEYCLEMQTAAACNETDANETRMQREIEELESEVEENDDIADEYCPECEVNAKDTEAVRRIEQLMIAADLRGVPVTTEQLRAAIAGEWVFV